MVNRIKTTRLKAVDGSLSKLSTINRVQPRQFAIVGNFVRYCGILYNITSKFRQLFVLLLASIICLLMYLLIPDFILELIYILISAAFYWNITQNQLIKSFPKSGYSLYLKLSASIHQIYNVQISQQLIASLYLFLCRILVYQHFVTNYLS
ncbi:Hypothetical_protein [Hexamita inflata]|uniref:Hypothetical_protein n=1 Tax=Hexamita inflata TaxID=28002 RepID=A0AA86TYF0_9EUKA|nr:Hypothetical protein HINF_LOCUS19427 [Hexamita inflata]